MRSAAMSSAVRSAGARVRTTCGVPSCLPNRDASGPKARPSAGLRGVGALLRLGVLGPPLRKRRLLAARKGKPGELTERAHVHRALEVDDLAHRFPVRHPAPLVELRLAGAGKIEAHLALEAQQEPALLLPGAQRLLVAPHVARRQAVAQPALGLPDELHVRLRDADLLVQFAKQRLLERLPAAQPALRELPALAPGAPPEKDLRALHQDDADVGAETIRVDDVAHCVVQSLPQRAAAVRTACARRLAGMVFSNNFDEASGPSPTLQDACGHSGNAGTAGSGALPVAHP